MEGFLVRLAAAAFVFWIVTIGLTSRKRITPIENARWVSASLASLAILLGPPGWSKYQLGANIGGTIVLSTAWLIIGFLIGYLWRRFRPVKAERIDTDMPHSPGVAKGVAYSERNVKSQVDQYAASRAQSAEEAWAIADRKTPVSPPNARRQDSNSCQTITIGATAEPTRQVGRPLSDDDIWSEVAREYEAGVRDIGLWTRIFSETDGDPEKTKARYFAARFRSIRGMVGHA